MDRITSYDMSQTLWEEKIQPGSFIEIFAIHIYRDVCMRSGGEVNAQSLLYAKTISSTALWRPIHEA
jgi:hypothetical protein